LEFIFCSLTPYRQGGRNLSILVVPNPSDSPDQLWLLAHAGIKNIGPQTPEAAIQPVSLLTDDYRAVRSWRKVRQLSVMPTDAEISQL